MEFDKSRVYTAVNADELPIGSICIFANTLGDLRTYVECDCAKCTFKVVADEHEEARFGNEQDLFWCLAYLIEPPAEPKYEPFENVEEAMKAIKAHGGWIRYKVSANYFFVLAYGNGSICINERYIHMQDLFDNYVFADDGSPCGVLVEE